VGSIRLDGVRFFAYPQDHEPPHVHGFYAETEAIVELRGNPVNEIELADRTDRVRPGNARQSDVKHIVRVAAAHLPELLELWRQAHA
jgi:hypothetical protein